MASKTKRSTGSATTAPKGRATAGRNETTERGPRISATMEWIIAAVVILAVIAGLFVLFGDVRSPLGGGHSGLAPVDPVVETVLVDGAG